MRPQAGQQCSVVPHTGAWIEIEIKTNCRKELRTFRPETEPQCGKN